MGESPSGVSGGVRIGHTVPMIGRQIAADEQKSAGRETFTVRERLPGQLQLTGASLRHRT